MADEVHVAITGSATTVEAAMQQAATAVRSGGRVMQTELEEVGLISEGVSHKIEHLGISMSFAASALADGSERGVTRAGHALAALGFAFDPAVGLLTTGIALATERMLEFFHKAQEEAQKTREKFEQEMGQLANAGKSFDLQNQLRDVQSGQPFDDKGKPVKPSDFVIGAYQNSLADLEARYDKLMAKIPAGASMAPRDIAEQINQLIGPLDAARTKARELMEAIENVKNQPAEMPGLLPSTTDAQSGEGWIKQFEQQSKQLQGEIDAFGRELDSKAHESLQKRMTEEVSASRQTAEELHTAAMKNLEDREKSAKDFIDYMQKIDEMGARLQKEQQDQTQREWQKTFDVVNSAWSSTIEKMRSGTDSIKNFWRDMWHDIVSQSIASLAKIAEAHAAHWLAVNNITALGVAKDVAITLAGAIKTIAMYAAKAAAAAWSAVAGIPYVGPFLAPAVAAATLAGVLALASGIGGGGGGGGGAAAPASSSGAPAGGASPSGGATYNIYAMDSQSFHQFAMKNAPTFAKAVTAAVPGGVRLPNSPGRG